jgi:glycosyltransferase involved in cell wall biosynthesis
MPRVTVIIPTFNYAQVLPFSIGSVLGQTFRDFELLVIGDCCTDDSESTVAAFTDSRVRWINLPQNIGHQSGPNNHGIQEARGELIAYLGHDDLWLPKHLALAVAAIDAGADLTYSLTEMVPPKDDVPWFAPQELDYFPGIWIPPSSVVHRKEAVLKAGGWKHFRETDIEPESELWIRMYRAGCRIKFLRKLTAIKFPALVRKDIYRTRATDEQRIWSARIAQEPDFVETELARMLVRSHWEDESYKVLMRAFAKQTGLRIRRRLKRFGRQKTQAQVYDDRLKFKGVIGPKE